MIFEKRLRNWDAQLKVKNRKILSFVDNRPAYTAICSLQYIELVFLPPNATSLLQPMDQGVIKSLKTQYRKLQVLRILQNIDAGEQRSLTVLDALLMVSEAWEKITQKTIANCFKHAGFKKLTPATLNEYQDDSNDDIPLSRLLHNNDDDDKEEYIPLSQSV